MRTRVDFDIDKSMAKAALGYWLSKAIGLGIDNSDMGKMAHWLNFSIYGKVARRVIFWQKEAMKEYIS